MYPCIVILLRAVDHGAEVGEQEIDCIWVVLFGLQPDLVGPLHSQPVQRLSVKVVLMLV